MADRQYLSFFLQFYDSYDKIQVLTLFWHLVYTYLVYTYKVLIGDKENVIIFKTLCMK